MARAENLPYSAAALMGRLPKTVVRVAVADGGLLLIDRADQTTEFDAARLVPVGTGGRVKVNTSARRPFWLQVLADDDPRRYQRPGMVMVASPSAWPVLGVLAIIRLPRLRRERRAIREGQREVLSRLLTLMAIGIVNAT